MQTIPPVPLDIAQDPAEAYGTPEALAARTDMPIEERLARLERWRADAILKEVAQAENMTCSDPSLLSRIGQAIISLGGAAAVDRA